MTRNAKLLRDVADKIEGDPHLYSQGTWGRVTPCGTAHCIAGWACELAGCEPNDPTAWEDGWLSVRKPGSTEFMPVGIAAEQLLGLSDIEALDLFDGGWKPKDGMTVPEALRGLADGKLMAEVSRDDWF